MFLNVPKISVNEAFDVPELLPAINAHLKCAKPSAEAFKTLFIILHSPQIVLKQIIKIFVSSGCGKGDPRPLKYQFIELSLDLGTFLFIVWLKLLPFPGLAEDFWEWRWNTRGKKGNFFQSNTQLRANKMINGEISAQP